MNRMDQIANKKKIKGEKTWHEMHEEKLTWGQRIADSVSGFVGSWPFLIVHIVWFFFWIALNVEPFPFGLLTMIVSLEAIFLSTFIMISQNRHDDRDRVQALDDYLTNVLAKEEIEEVQRNLFRIENEKLNEILSRLPAKKKHAKNKGRNNK